MKSAKDFINFFQTRMVQRLKIPLQNVYVMLKAQLRKQALQQRLALNSKKQAQLNHEILEQFKQLDFSNIRQIHFFLPISHQHEPDTFLMIEWLKENFPAIEIVVPKADFASNLMEHYYYSDKADLLINQYHIPEPQHAKPFRGVPDMVMVPLLAFDKRGYRVGYGKGFYDRFLQGISTIKIGISFFGPATEIIDVHLNDIRLDKCITPTGIITFDKTI